MLRDDIKQELFRARNQPRGQRQFLVLLALGSPCRHCRSRSWYAPLVGQRPDLNLHPADGELRSTQSASNFQQQGGEGRGQPSLCAFLACHDAPSLQLPLLAENRADVHPPAPSRAAPKFTLRVCPRIRRPSVSACLCLSRRGDGAILRCPNRSKRSS
jgi:hypothetical protein